MRTLALLVLVAIVGLTKGGSAQTSDRTPCSRRSTPRRQAYGDVALQIWSFAEVGYQETKSSALLQEQLEGAGFDVKAGVAEIPTAFTATWGTGKPVIGIIGEFDALPGLSQAADARSQGRRARRPGSWLRTSPVRHRLDGCRDCGQGVAGRQQAIGHAALLRHACRGGRRRQGLHAARRPLRRCGCGGHDAPGRSQRRQRLQQPREHHRQVPLPRPVGARRGGARARPLGARRRRSHGRHGQHDARARRRRTRAFTT